jgi:hypothetical protein
MTGLLLLFALFAPGAWAQGPPPPPPPPPLMAPRDATPNPTGTAVVRGRVVRADTRQPLRRAQVQVTGGSLRSPITATANARGAFEIRELPAGRYRVTARRAGYLTIENGQRYPGEAGMPVDLPSGGEIEVAFAMPRASVVAGRILDETGDVVAQASVSLLQPRWFEGERKLAMIGRATSDDAGEYRITNVLPGEYVVMATVRETWTARTPEPVVLGYAPTYYPSTTSGGDAGRVQVEFGQEVTAVDITLIPGRTASISGTAQLADGSALGGGTLVLTQRIAGPTALSTMTIANARIGPDGRWEFREIPPGHYEIGLAAGSAPQGTYVLRQSVSLSGVNVSALTLSPVVPAAVSGVVRTDDGSALPRGLPLRVLPETLEPGQRRTPSAAGNEGAVATDGTFTITSVPPGRTLLRMQALPPGWGVSQILVGGRDHASTPIDAGAGQRIDDVQVVVSRRLPAVSGRVVGDDGEPAYGTVLLFPVDPAAWVESAGTLHHARPDQRGSFRIEHVRPGEYFAIALEYVPTWQVTDPELLNGLRSHASKVTVAEEDSEPLTLRVRR